MKKFTGGCLCGSLQYEITGSIGTIVHCHCSECRRWHGSAFRTRASVKSEYFRWTRGEESLGRYEQTPEAPWFEITDDLPQYDEMPLGSPKVFNADE